MTRGRRWSIASALGALALGWPCVAAAQVHWDLGVEVGATERITNANRATPEPLPGPSAEIHAHIAVLPMLRVGPYLSFDLSPASGTPARQVYAGGLRAKVAAPVLSAPWRAW